MDTETQLDTATRNTKRKSRAFLGTWNNYPDDYEERLKAFDKFVFQKEIGESGNEHIQFAIYCKNATSWNSICNKLEGAHVEIAKNWNACVNYCSKSSTAVEGTLCDNVRKKVRDPLEGKELLPLQARIMQIIKHECDDDRVVHWIVDPLGCSGKTTLAKSLCLRRKDCIYLTGKASDMKFGIYKWLEKNELGIVLIDLARSQEGFVSYQGIEEIKNGIFYNTKYESSMCVFDSPHVIVFANFEPERSKLSHDRWNIIRTQETQETQDTEDTVVGDELINFYNFMT